MQALCHWEVHHEESPESLEDFLISRRELGAATGYATKVVNEYWDRRAPIDERIRSVASNWDLSRMSPVERNIMRIAVVELSASEVPPKVALNEAIEIGREYGGEDSPRFINGILDAILKRSQRPAEDRG